MQRGVKRAAVSSPSLPGAENPLESGLFFEGPAALRGSIRGLPELLRDLGNGAFVGGLTGPENRDPAFSDERQAELGRYGGLRERLCEGNAELATALLLCTTPDDLEVRQRGGVVVQELALAALRLEERDLPIRQPGGQWDSRRAPA